MKEGNLPRDTEAPGAGYYRSVSLYLPERAQEQLGIETEEPIFVTTYTGRESATTVYKVGEVSQAKDFDVYPDGGIHINYGKAFQNGFVAVVEPVGRVGTYSLHMTSFGGRSYHPRAEAVRVLEIRAHCSDPDRVHTPNKHPQLTKGFIKGSTPICDTGVHTVNSGDITHTFSMDEKGEFTFDKVDHL